MTTVGVLFTAYLVLLALLLVGTLALSARRAGGDGSPDRATVSWSSAMGLLLLAWLLFAARWVLPLPWLEAAACAILLAGYIEMARGLAIEADTRVPGLLAHAPSLLTAVVLGVAQLRGWPPQQRVLAFWLCALLALLVATWTVRALRRSPRWWPERALALLFLLAAPLLVWRAVAQLTAPSGGPALDDMSLVQAAVLVYFVQVPVLASFGFLHMQHRRRSAQMRYLATHDALTGLSNRESFLVGGARALRDAAWRRRPVAVLMLDLDHFKAINDRHGHAAGDAALQGAAAALHGAVRDSDLAARLGGDEFAVLLSGATPEVALEVAQRIAERIARVDLGGVPNLPPGVRVTASIGIAVTARAHAESLDELLRRADARLYEAKQQGRDRITAAPAADMARVPA